MITAEGAGVIATIIPIGLLIVGFEVRGATLPTSKDRISVIGRWYLSALFGIGLLLGFVAEAILVTAVSSSSGVDGFEVVFVWAGLFALACGSFALMGASLLENIVAPELKRARSENE